VAPADLRAIPAAAHTIDPEMPIHIHVAEQTREVAACQAAHGTTPVAFLLDHAAVDGRWCLIHATHMDQAETARLAATGAVAGLCPTTEANLGDGVFPLELYLGRGGRLGVGSDSHVSLDPRDELRLLEDTRRLLSQQRNRVATAASPHVGAHLYDLALHGGAQAAGAPVGRLAPGHRADLVVLDRDHPSLAACPDAHLLDAWLLTRHGSPVRAVAVAGDWVVRDGRHRAAEPVAGAYRAAVRSLAF
jgi:formimidoylglutamate deiminase